MHKSHDKKAPTLSAAEAAEGRGASFTGEHARRTTSGSMQGMSPGQARASCLPRCVHVTQTPGGVVPLVRLTLQRKWTVLQPPVRVKAR